MQTTPCIFLRCFLARTFAAGQILAVLAGWFVVPSTVYPASGTILPVGCIQIRGSDDSWQMTLLDDSDEAVNDVVLEVMDSSIAGALLFVRGLPRGRVLTLQPRGQPAGDAALYRGDSFLVVQPPPIGDTDSWTLQIHAPTPHAGVTATIAGMILEIEHAEMNGACEAAGMPGGSSFDPSLIIIRIKPLPVVPPAEEWLY